jgi:hypothetical protein
MKHLLIHSMLGLGRSGLALMLLAVMCIAAHADDFRTWKSVSGTELEAKFIAKTASDVTLEKRDGTRISLKAKQLSVEDQIFLQTAGQPTAPAPAPAVTGQTTVAGIDAAPGKVSHEITCVADAKWTYQLYLPMAFHTGRKWPVAFLMDPGGGSSGTVKRYIPAAEHLGMILAVSRQCKNDFVDADVAMYAMVKDVTERLPMLPELSIASGMSGGSRMAYLLAETDKNIGGVLACGSGSGVYLHDHSFRPAKLRKSTVICSIMGSNDYNRREAAESHARFSKDARLMWFIGKHTWADEDLLTEGISHLYGKILGKSKEPAVVALQAEFAKKQMAWAKERQDKEPWRTYLWAEFLTVFPDAPTQTQAKALVAELAVKEPVKLALKAEKTIQAFVGKYLENGDTSADKSANPARESETERKAAEFATLPQGELLKQMGKPGTK